MTKRPVFQPSTIASATSHQAICRLLSSAWSAPQTTNWTQLTPSAFQFAPTASLSAPPLGLVSQFQFAVMFTMAVVTAPLSNPAGSGVKEATVLRSTQLA